MMADSNISGEEERRVLNQYLAQTLAKNEVLRQEFEDKEKKWNEKRLAQEEELARLKQANEFLKQELKQMQERCANLKRQEQLLNPIKHRQQSKSNLVDSIVSNSTNRAHTCAATEKLAEAQRQITILTDYIELKEKEQQQKLAQIQQIHLNSSRKSDSGSCICGLDEKVKALEKDKKRLEINIEKCKRVLEESQNYYLGQIQKVKDQCTNWQDRCRNMETQKQEVLRELEEAQTRCQAVISQCQQKLKEADISQRLASQNLEKKYEDFIEKMTADYENKLASSQEQMRLTKAFFQQSTQNFQSLGEIKPYTPARFAMAESKLLPEKAMTESYRLTSGSFSSSIKEQLSRKSRFEQFMKNGHQNNNRTPVKNRVSRSPYSNLFADRTNHL